ncbi:MAG: cupin domain-containing protein [Pseudomonadota bacterium]
MFEPRTGSLGRLVLAGVIAVPLGLVAWGIGAGLARDVATDKHADKAANSGTAPKASIEKLLITSKTVLDQPIRYPEDGQAKVTAVIVTMPPGSGTGWHLHQVPLFGYMLEGELTVTYKGHGQKVYRKGDSLMEAMNIAHDGQNLSDKPVRILAVFMGGEGAKNTVKLGPGVE